MGKNVPFFLRERYNKKKNEMKNISVSFFSISFLLKNKISFRRNKIS